MASGSGTTPATCSGALAREAAPVAVSCYPTPGADHVGKLPRESLIHFECVCASLTSRGV
eukprot:2211100-Pleurochrysis_carterae.AAC.1